MVATNILRVVRVRAGAIILVSDIGRFLNSEAPKIVNSSDFDRLFFGAVRRQITEVLRENSANMINVCSGGA